MSPAVAGRAAGAIALVGTPNCGKTTLFNALTGLRQKVANYPGVTVEKKEGWLETEGAFLKLVDLPGLYSLDAQTPEEAVTERILRDGAPYGARPSAVLVILDGSSLDRSLALFASVAAEGLPVAAALTMSDEIKARGGRLDPDALSRELGAPVVAVVGHRGLGLEDVRRLLGDWRRWPAPAIRAGEGAAARYAWAQGVAARALGAALREDGVTRRIDRWALDPIAGPLIFLGVMALFFQSIFSWAQPAMEALSALADAGSAYAVAALPPGALRGFVAHGVIQGAGSVVVFLPQILVLFFFLFLLEDVGYLARAAFLMDRIMGWAGLQGRCFVALLSSYACAVPGIMATRGIPSPQDRLTTILVAPFMTCSARLPVYALLVGAFVPDAPVLGPIRAQGAALLALYLAGSASAFLAAWALRANVLRGDLTPFYIELPPYRFPTFRGVVLAMLDRASVFLRRAGTVILAVSVGLWLLLNFPRLPEPAPGEPAADAPRASLQMRHSLGGRLGQALEPVFAPLGFDWRINVGIIGSLVAREVVVSTLAQIYAVEAGDDGASLRRALRDGRDPRTGRPLMTRAAAMSLLAFFVYALQCISTLAVIRRETNSWRWPAFAFSYMFACAWVAGAVTYRVCGMAGL